MQSTDVASSYWDTLGEIARTLSIMAPVIVATFFAIRHWRGERIKSNIKRSLGIPDDESLTPMRDMVRTELEYGNGHSVMSKLDESHRLAQEAIDALGELSTSLITHQEALADFRVTNEEHHERLAGDINRVHETQGDMKSEMASHITHHDSKAETITEKVDTVGRKLERVEDYLLRRNNG